MGAAGSTNTPGKQLLGSCEAERKNVLQYQAEIIIN
jgi:hypothetical protein